MNCSEHSIAIPRGEMSTHEDTSVVSTTEPFLVTNIVPDMGVLSNFRRLPSNSYNDRTQRARLPAGISFTPILRVLPNRFAVSRLLQLS